MSKERLPKAVYEQLALFRYQIRKFIHFSESAARAHGLTPQNHQLMLAIMGFPGRDYATPKELAERLQVTPHACVELINRCEQLQLVYRMPNPDDGRSIFIRLSESGMRLLEDLSEIHMNELKNIGLLEFPEED
ncbi:MULTISPECIES: MarR family winged helix-turn-helix transcriptional regulator [Paenibacillus]|uniref:MarR family transcriptional regulator n=1 Tax=Paenibacillus violae TaxID=3077234 RepID=A0ABU3RHC9_9BACL|nr:MULTISPECIES: MarR family transcriptional regulator [Paenibacillus]MDU0203660.1 MarR family transcriptional regulator [Paenibacillus sp. PFR10]MEC0271133.1 MarR family transcriptional regulator [Paenibacillus anseongense]